MFVDGLTRLHCQVRSPEQLFGGAREAIEGEVRALGDKMQVLEARVSEAVSGAAGAVMAQLEQRCAPK